VARLDLEEVPDEDWHALYWRAWEALRYDRVYGAFGGQLPLSYQSISRYARDQGIGGDDLATFHRLMAAIDDEWLTHVAETTKREK